MAYGNSDDQSDDFELDDGITEDTESDASASDDGEDTDDAEASSGGDVDKRIRELQSKADAAEARANKLEKALKAKDAGKPTGTAGANDPATQALMTELREASLDAIFGEYPELKEFGIDRGLIEGTTRAEMREAATSLVGLIKAVSTKARNKALAEAGVKVEPQGSRSSKPVDYATMPAEEFEKLLSSIG